MKRLLAGIVAGVLSLLLVLSLDIAERSSHLRPGLRLDVIPSAFAQANTPSTVTGLGISLAAPGPIGSTTPSTGAFTTVTAATVTNCNLPTINFAGNPTSGLANDFSTQVSVCVAAARTAFFAATSWGVGSAVTEIQPSTSVTTALGDSTHVFLHTFATDYISAGTKFTTNAGCGESAGTTTGGATAGKFTTAGSTSCTSIVTFGNTATAPNGWACYAHDLTTTGDYNNPRTSSNGTTLTIVTGTIVASDVIEFGCVGY